MQNNTGWEIEDSIIKNLLLSDRIEDKKILEDFVAAYGSLAALDLNAGVLCIVRRFHPTLNCPPETSNEYSLRVAYYSIGSSECLFLPKMLTYQKVALVPTKNGKIHYPVDIVITTLEYGDTVTNVWELREKMCDNYVPLEPSLQLAAFSKLSNETWDSEPKVPIIDTEITLSGVGVFTQADFNDWWQCVLPIPFLAQSLPVTILNFNPNDPANESQLGAIDAALTALLRLTEMEKSIAAPVVFSYCHEFLDMVEILDEDKAIRETTNPEEIWKFVHFTHAYVQYDASTEVAYVSLHAKCDWDAEHGLQLVYKNGTELYRVSADDGQIHNSPRTCP